jgi:hypothetical protein
VLASGERREVTYLMTHLKKIARERARFPLHPSPRWLLHERNYAPWWRPPEQGAENGLSTAKHSRYGDADVGVISKARAGAYALGYVVDSLYPPEVGPFCPCCRQPVSDTWAHHLLGHCALSADLAQQRLPDLRALMAAGSPEWCEEYGALDIGDDQRAALILCAADAPNLCWTTRDQVAQLLANWLTEVLQVHPLCSRLIAPRGSVDRCMRYQDRPYDFMPWTADQDEALQRTLTDAEAEALFPAKLREQVRRRRRHLLRYTRGT